MSPSGHDKEKPFGRRPEAKTFCTNNPVRRTVLSKTEAPGAPDIWCDGVFPKDPGLKDFWVSRPAVFVALQMQNSFEMKRSQQDCERMIEDYAYWGGDGGLTEKVMREACGMLPRDVRNIAKPHSEGIGDAPSAEDGHFSLNA